ncbi:hypothetical protein GH733_010777 [Mirounga leonina]|nr:hypothetical protein GH733_010777 [Mirounga leonina]
MRTPTDPALPAPPSEPFLCRLHASRGRKKTLESWVRVEGYNYIGMGNSTNKKDAQSNAARDFVNYLVRINEVKSEEVPAVGVST